MSLELDVNCTLSGYWSLQVKAGDTNINMTDVNPNDLLPVLADALGHILYWQGNGFGYDLINSLINLDILKESDIKSWVAAKDEENEE
jgi:hypothetical protein